MKRKRLFMLFLLLLLSFAVFSVVSASGKTLELVIGDDQPPSAMQNAADGNHGYNVEIFQAICSKAGFDPKVTYQPWIRVQDTVSKGKDLVTMGLVKSPDRENKYLWVCKVYTLVTTFASINGKAYDAETAKSLKSVLLQSGTPMEAKLTALGFTNLAMTASNSSNAQKLANGRGDAWMVSYAVAKWTWKKENLPGKLTFGPTFSTSDQWLALSPGSDPAIASALEKGFNAIKADGTYKKILDKYLE